MMEMKIKIEVPDLAAAVEKLAAAMTVDPNILTPDTPRPRPHRSGGPRSRAPDPGGKPYPGGRVCSDCPDCRPGCTAGWPDLCVPF